MGKRLTVLLVGFCCVTACLAQFVARDSDRRDYTAKGFRTLATDRADAGGAAFVAITADTGPSLPHVADSNARLSLTAAGAVVSGAGTTEVNGTYIDKGFDTGTGRITYLISGYEIKDGTSGIYWDGEHWTIKNSGGITAYTATGGDVERPWLSPSWDAAGGDPPSPTVAAAGTGVTGAGYQVIQDSDGLTYTFNGDGADADAGLWVKDAGSAPDNGAYSIAIDGNYNQIPSGTSFTGGPGWVTNDGQYNITAPSTYPWEQPWDVAPFIGTPPAPTVLRNPICAEANWSHP